MARIDLLIVDDSPAFKHLTKIAIHKAGLDCNITEVSNGQRALSYLAETLKCPDIILLDINMPVMDGFEFLGEYVKSHKCVDKTLLYVLTSSSQDIDKVKVRSFGIVRDYFEKPLSKENIYKIITDIQAG